MESSEVGERKNTVKVARWEKRRQSYTMGEDRQSLLAFRLMGFLCDGAQTNVERENEVSFSRLDSRLDQCLLLNPVA